MRQIYLDYNATTPIDPRAREAMLPFLHEHFGNPSSAHALGRACQEAIRDARAKLAQALGAASDEIVFTSGATEANNLALKGLAFKHWPARGHVVISAIEHASVAEPAAFLERLGSVVTRVGCDADGVVQPADVQAALRPETVLVSVMHANNETGVIQPIRDMADVCRAAGVTFHTDAAQTFGKLPLNVEQLGADLVTLAGHKVYGPKGIGALYVRRGLRLDPLLHGAGHEGGLRSGMENVPHIVAFGEAAKAATENLADEATRLASLRDRLIEILKPALDERTPVAGLRGPRLPNTILANFAGVSGEELLRRVPEVCAATVGGAQVGDVSPTLAAMGIPADVAQGAVRLSLGRFTTYGQVETAGHLLLAAWEAIR